MSSKVVNHNGKLQLIFFFSVLFLVMGALIELPRLSIPLTVGYIIFLIVNPAIPTLIKLGFSRSWSIAILFFGIIFFSTYPLVKIVPMIKQQSENLTYYYPKVESYVKKEYQSVRVKIKKISGYEIGDQYIGDGISWVRQTTTNILLNIPKIVGSVLEWFFLVPLFIFFMLKDGHALKRTVLKLVPNSIFERFYYLSHQFNKQLGDYIFAKFVEASIVGIIITTGLLIMDVRFSLLLGLVAGITNIIPYVGPVLGMVPGIILALVEHGWGPQFGGVFLLYMIANAIDIGLVFPILVSKIVDIHPVLVVVSVILGSQYFGIIGMIISIPMVAALKLIVLEIYKEIYAPRIK
ncbi:MAG: AI-2E family transporter [Halobacteriovoraceae bacterium]|nr:AI-2E family transporter [Halobacteriovoraceae bacterium]MBT5095919.1 AI-2E family transporter [Halobacteriovoraceae bacterium]